MRRDRPPWAHSQLHAGRREPAACLHRRATAMRAVVAPQYSDSQGRLDSRRAPVARGIGSGASRARPEAQAGGQRPWRARPVGCEGSILHTRAQHHRGSGAAAQSQCTRDAPRVRGGGPGAGGLALVVRSRCACPRCRPVRAHMPRVVRPGLEATAVQARAQKFHQRSLRCSSTGVGG
jgi:hypothetical protein